MLVSETTLLDLVGAIHDGAADETAEAALTRISDALGGATVVNVLAPVSPNTAKFHAKRIFDTLDVEGQAQRVLRVATVVS